MSTDTDNLPAPAETAIRYRVIYRKDERLEGWYTLESHNPSFLDWHSDIIEADPVAAARSAIHRTINRPLTDIHVTLTDFTGVYPAAQRLSPSHLTTWREDLTEEDYDTLDLLDLTDIAHGGLGGQGSGRWEFLPATSHLSLSWIEPWDRSHPYLAVGCSKCRDYRLFEGERPSYHPKADAFLAQHKH